MKEKIYFDNAATEKPKQEVVDAVINTIKEGWYNPNSAYENAHETKMKVEECREIVANSIGADPKEIIFTSGSTESNALALDGWEKVLTDEYYSWILTSKIEHASIMKNPHVIKGIINNDNNGLIDLKCLEMLMESYAIGSKDKVLVTISAANSEIGTIQPVDDISELVHDFGGIYHCDATQAYCKIPINVKEMGIDMMSASAHKIGGIKGCGFLYVKNNTKLRPMLYGEQGIRSGTPNVPGIIGLAKAVEITNFDINKNIEDVRNYLIKQLLLINGIHINGSVTNRLPGNVNFRIDNMKIDNMQMVGLFDQMGFELSAGSACHAYSPEPSKVLKAIGLSDKEAMSSLRITLNEYNTIDEIDKFINALKFMIEMYRR